MYSAAVVRQGHRSPVANVLIVDDSAVARAALSRIIEEADGLHVAATVVGATQAIAFLADHLVDVILLDLDMPGRGGLAALPELLAAGRGAHVLVVSSSAEAGAAATLSALRLGASDTLFKPTAGSINQNFGKVLADRVARLGATRGIEATSPGFELAPIKKTPVGLVAIGASTGGIRALFEFFKYLPTSFASPIAITQHLPHAFMTHFAFQLNAMSGRPAVVAVDGDIVHKGQIVLAPGDAHLTFRRADQGLVVALSDAPVHTRCCPSVDPMLESAGDVLGAAAVGVVLTGMGRDGVEGARHLVGTGASVIVQDEASSTVWGMPGSVARSGLASVVGSPRRLAEHVGARGAV